jgi:hypothetical protein
MCKAFHDLWFWVGAGTALAAQREEAESTTTSQVTG